MKHDLLTKLDGLDQNFDELNRKFAHTIIEGWPSGLPAGDPSVIYVAEIGAVIIDGTGARIAETKKFMLSREYPSIGWFNHNDTCFYLRRNPRRQWKRGVCRDNTLIYANPSESLGGFDLSLITSAFQYRPNGTSIRDAIALIRGGQKRGVALSNKYALKLEGSSINLYRNLVPMGSFEGRVFFFNSDCDCFKTELKDDLGDLNVT